MARGGGDALFSQMWLYSDGSLIFFCSPMDQELFTQFYFFFGFIRFFFFVSEYSTLVAAIVTSV